VLRGRNNFPPCWRPVIGSSPTTAEGSANPATGYNYDAFAEDLHKLVTQLKLRDFTLVGFSMGMEEPAIPSSNDYCGRRNSPP
jgi:pimeloyl-ACP methyl ester carboxylesterase